MNTLASLDHRIYLYINAPPAPRPPRTLPPLRVELFPDGNLKKLMELVAIVFSVPGLPTLRWSDAAAWLELPPMLAPPVFGGASKFIAALPSLEDWMSAWSASDQRQPDLTPDWAQSLGIHKESVAEVAEAIRNELASSDETVIRFCDASGNEQRLRILARASLNPPQTPVAQEEVVVVQSVQRVHVYTSPAGTKFGVPEPAGDPERAICQTLDVSWTDVKPTRIVRVANPRVIIENE